MRVSIMRDDKKYGLMEHIKQHTAIYMAALFFLAVGIASGIFTFIGLPKNESGEISIFLKAFLGMIKSAELNIFAAVAQSIFTNAIFFILMAIFGMFTLGLPLIFVLMVSKGFMVAFAAAAFMTNFGLTGSLMAFLCVIVPAFVICGDRKSVV